MKKFLLSLVSLFMLTFAVQAGEIKIAYTGSTTTNMTGENDAALFGLSADDWSIVGSKGGSDLFPGLNKAGDIRLYYNADGCNTIAVSVLKEGAVINKITSMSFNTGKDNVTVTVNGNPVEAVDGEYTINATSFVLGNGNTSNVQVQIKNVILDVDGIEGQEIVHIANTAETAYTIAEAIDLIDAGEALDETVYVKGIVSQVDKFNSNYKSIQYWISDDGTTTNQFECYSGKGIGGADFASIDDVKVGATVVVKGTLKKYNDVYEFNQNNELVSYEAPADPASGNVDYTTSIVNPSFETGDLTGWTVGNSSDTGVKPNSNGTYTTEGCDGAYLFNTWWQGIPITQTVTGLPNGLYELKALMANDAITAGNKPCLYLLANGAHSEAFGSENAGKFTECSIQFYVTDGTATIGAIGGNADGSFNEAGYYWYKVDNFRLTFVENLPAIDEIEIPEGKMSNDAASAITTAKEAGDVVALINAVEAAKASIEGYAKFKSTYDLITAEVAATNLYTAEAKATFDTAMETAQNAYADGTMSDADASSFTYGSRKDGLLPTLLLSAYGETPLYINTWSVEGVNDGTNFLVPFFEYWVTDANSLAAATHTATITGLEAGLYTVDAWVRVRAKNGFTAPAYGITADVNGGEAVDVCAGEAVEGTNFFLAKFTVVGRVAEDGILKFNLNVAEDNNISWLSFKNVKYTAKDEKEYAYEQALKAIADGGKYRVYTVVDETTYYLKADGKLTANEAEAKAFTFSAVNVDGTLYKTGWDLGYKFTNPTLSGGSTGDVVQKGNIIVGDYNRNDWERQVFFFNGEKYAVRSTNANSANWGANTYWDVIDGELPTAGYSLEASYVWQLQDMTLVEAQAEVAAAIAAANAFSQSMTQEDIAALAEINPAALASVEACKEAIQSVKKALADYVAALPVETSIDITGLITNATPVDNLDGWTGTGIGGHSDGVAEYWNVAAGSFKQAINLPAGSYKLTVVALTRTGMKSTIFAGENTAAIATVGSGDVDNRAQAAAWFAAGNGVNELFFTVAEAGDVEIGLTADNTSGDHWTVWQSFKLEKLNPALALRDELVAAVNAANATVTAKENVGDAMFQKPTEAFNTFAEVVTAAQAVAENADATAEELTTAKADLATAVATYAAAINAPKAGAKYTLQQKSSGLYLALSEAGVALAAEPYELSWEIANDGWYITDGNLYVGWAGSNNWTMSSAPDKKMVINPTLAEIEGVVYYTLNEAKGLIATDGTEAGAACYTDKSVSGSGDKAYWTIAEVAEPVDPNDYTSYIINADLSDAASTAWNLEGTKGYHSVGGVVTAGNNAVYDFNQTIVGLPAGKYQVSVQAAYRYGADEQAEANAYFDDAIETKFAKLYATVGEKTVNVLVKNRYDGASDTDWANGEGSVVVEGKPVPNSTAAVKAWFDAKQYTNVLEFNLVEAGNVTIGIVKTAQPEAGDYTVIGPWTLTRIGDAETEPEPQEQVLNKEINVERYIGLGYTAQIETVDFTEALEFLGVEAVTYDMLRIVNPDDTEISDYAPYDGWFNGEGVAETWGANTKINVKFFEAIPDGEFSICDMNGADVVDAEYSVKWALVYGDKKVIYTIGVKFVDVPPVVIEISDKVFEASVDYETSEGSYSEKRVALTSDQISAICAELGVESLEGTTAYGYNPTTKELVANYAGFDGWRDANGDFHNWTGDGNAPACVKYVDGQSFLCYNIAGLEPQTIDCYWAIATETKAVLVKISLNYVIPVGINGLNSELKNANIFDLNGRKVSKVQKGGIYIVNGKKMLMK